MLALTLRRFENGDGLGNHEENLFNLRDIDKFQKFKNLDQLLCTYWFRLLIMELGNVR